MYDKLSNLQHCSQEQSFTSIQKEKIDNYNYYKENVDEIDLIEDILNENEGSVSDRV
jgi:hypothetical protein